MGTRALQSGGRAKSFQSKGATATCPKCCGEPTPCPWYWRVPYCSFCVGPQSFVCVDFQCGGHDVTEQDVLHWGGIYCGSPDFDLGKYIADPKTGDPPPPGFIYLPDDAFVISDAECLTDCEDDRCQSEECEPACCMRYRIHRKTFNYDCQGLASTYEITRWGSYDSTDGFVTGFYQYEIFNFRTGAHEIVDGDDFNPWSGNPGYCNPAYPDVFAEVAVGINTPCPDGTRPWYDSPSGSCGTPAQGLVYVWDGQWDKNTGGSFTWTKDEYTRNCDPNMDLIATHSIGDGEWATGPGPCSGLRKNRTVPKNGTIRPNGFVLTPWIGIRWRGVPMPVRWWKRLTGQKYDKSGCGCTHRGKEWWEWLTT